MLMRWISAVLACVAITSPVVAGPPTTNQPGAAAGDETVLHRIAAIVIDWGLECDYQEALGETHITSSKSQDPVYLDYSDLKRRVREGGVCRVWPMLYVSDAGEPSIMLMASAITPSGLHVRELRVRCDGTTKKLDCSGPRGFDFIRDWVWERVSAAPDGKLVDAMIASNECYASMVGSSVYIAYQLSSSDKKRLNAFAVLQRLLVSAKASGLPINSAEFYEAHLVAAMHQVRESREAERLREKRAAKKAAAEALERRRQEREERRAEQRDALKLSLERLKSDEGKDNGLRWYRLTISNPTDESIRNVVIQIRGKYKKNRMTLSLKKIKAGKAYSKQFEWRDPKKPRAKVVSVGKAI